MRQKGFTLIELLVVISIIALLSSVVLASLNSSRAKARNARRNADARQLALAFNLGLTTSNSLPLSGGAWRCISATCYDGWAGTVANATVDAFLAPGIASKPEDPPGGSRGFGGYIYKEDWVGGTSTYDSSVFPTGPYLDWVVEPPLTATSCGIGRIWWVGANVIECLYKLN